VFMWAVDREYVNTPLPHPHKNYNLVEILQGNNCLEY